MLAKRQHARMRVLNALKSNKTLASRFWANIIKGEGCWEWQGGKDENGYGRINVEGTVIRTHVVGYFLKNGIIPEAGKVLDHLCENPACARYDHLDPVTQTVNVSRFKKNHPVLQCPHGHSYQSENAQFFTYKSGPKKGYKYRYCRECSRIKARRIHSQQLALRTPKGKLQY